MEEDSSPTTRSTPEEESEVLIKYVQEKDNLRGELRTKEKEVLKYKATVYDLSEEIKQLKEELKAANKNLKSRQLPLSGDNSNVPSNKLGVVRPSTARRSPMVQRAKSAKSRGQGRLKKAGSTSSAPKTPEPKPDASNDNDMQQYKKAMDRVDLYDKVATKFPELKLSVLIKAEQFFRESDINNDGTIDEEELEKLLMKQGHLFTNKEIKDIMSQIDVDKTGTIDLMEYLAVMERVQQRKRVNLPPGLTRSSVCSIQ